MRNQRLPEWLTAPRSIGFDPDSRAGYFQSGMGCLLRGNREALLAPRGSSETDSIPAPLLVRFQKYLLLRVGIDNSRRS